MAAIHDLIYKFGWDTRCRNIDVASVLRPSIGTETTILDAGCGNHGLAAFMPTASITGVDVLPASDVDSSLKYIHGSILDLPFDDGSFDIAVSVDVLEHLPADLRASAVQQMIRVARRAIVITFPAGEYARKIDAAFAAELDRRKQPLPEWLEEHLRDRYPESHEITKAIEEESSRRSRRVTVKTLHSEHSSAAKALRWAAARSKYIYIAANVAAGVALPIMPRATADNAYRSIVVAEFDR